jgi:hypothetical protein
MPLISLSVQHGRTQDEARRRLEETVREISTTFGAAVRRVQWTVDRTRARLEGVGFWLEMWVDAQAIHVTGDAPLVGRLLGGRVGSRLRDLVERTLRKQLP